MHGNIQFTKNQKPVGAPFTAGSANNGLSQSATGQIVFGNDPNPLNDPTLDPAKFLSDREINFAGNGLNFKNVTAFTVVGGGPFGTGTQELMRLGNISASFEVTFGSTGGSGSFSVTGAGQGFISQLRLDRFAFSLTDDQGIEGSTSFSFGRLTGNFFTKGTLQTGTPSTGPGGIWNFGSLITGAAGSVVANGASYIEVKVDNVIRKLVIAN